jgi:hypothetical protein
MKRRMLLLLQRNAAGPNLFRVPKSPKTIGTTATTGLRHPYLQLGRGGQPQQLDHDPNPSRDLLPLWMPPIFSTTTTTNPKESQRCPEKPPGPNPKREDKKQTVGTRGKDQLRGSRLDRSRRPGKSRRM